MMNYLQFFNMESVLCNWKRQVQDLVVPKVKYHFGHIHPKHTCQCSYASNFISSKKFLMSSVFRIPFMQLRDLPELSLNFLLSTFVVLFIKKKQKQKKRKARTQGAVNKGSAFSHFSNKMIQSHIILTPQGLLKGGQWEEGCAHIWLPLYIVQTWFHAGIDKRTLNT